MDFEQSSDPKVPAHLLTDFRRTNSKIKLPVHPSQSFDEMMAKFESPEARAKYMLKMWRMDKNQEV